MVRPILHFVIIIHGLIHFLGFVKAFNPASVNQVSQNIPMGYFGWLPPSYLLQLASYFFKKR